MHIPNAGVRTFFSFRILDLLGKKFGHWFDEGNLTEDYEVSMKISRIGGKQMFLLVRDPLGEVVATREYFPADFGRSIRQKTRWTTGIALQTMMTWGSYGNPLEVKSLKSLLARYGIWRDRKALWANPIIFLARTVFFLCLSLHLINPQWMGQLSENKLLLSLMILNLFLFAVRVFQRARFTTALYGIKHGLFTFPRLILRGAINGSAALRAIDYFNDANKSNKTDQIEWDKTDHSFP